IVAACKPALEHRCRDVSLFVQRILNHLPVDMLSAAAEEPSHSFPSSARDASEGILHRFDIRTLGGFEVRRENGARINDAEWTGIRQQLLLKAIVVHGCREIPKDILMDALWPESKYDAALKRFKVTLHRLRRILEPDMDQRYGASCIILKDNRISLDMRRCRVDVNDFLAACNLVRQLAGDDDDQRRLSACRRAIDIYRGEFLPEELYLGWAEMKRAALKDQYLAVLVEMVEILERSGDLAQAVRYCEAVIQADPLAEQAAQRLMRLLLRQGRSSAALQVYRNLTQALASELDTGPDSSTIRIYGEILNR
ncbi:BTAD domain-containing putative transcriptional regulator, partial [Desulfosarcina sp.]|uniref:AfsR/SARP family transcriptional regulator n=1 Tax=Desulfosarcina sp. TaxID=2027861 RepID=UPI003970D475